MVEQFSREGTRMSVMMEEKRVGCWVVGWLVERRRRDILA